MKELDALFFAAHPDDAELCCGGTIAAIVKSGKKAGIVDLTKGELGTRGSVNLRSREASDASKILGLHFRVNLGIPDGNIQNNPSNRHKIIKIIRKLRPKLIFFPHYHDRHPDHYNTHILVKQAAFYSGLEKIKTAGLSAYRPKRSFYYMQTYAFEPDFIADISDTYSLKIKAIKCYSSQFYTADKSKKNTIDKVPQTFISTENFMQFIEARSVFYGFQIGVKYGEAYCTDGKIKLAAKNLFEV